MAGFAKYIAAGMCSSSLGAVVLAIGMIFASLIFSTSRAPWLQDFMTGQAFLGFALCESMALIILLVTILLIYA